VEGVASEEGFDCDLVPAGNISTSSPLTVYVNYFPVPRLPPAIMASDNELPTSHNGLLDRIFSECAVNLRR
jgi:hypothetical protein